MDDWRDVRQAYLRSVDGDDPTFAFAEQDRDLLTSSERLRAAEMITLWIGTGLAEQLLLVWVVTFLRRLGVDTAKLQTVQFDHDRKHQIVSVGVLNPSQFKDHPRPTTLDDAAVKEAADAWKAVTEPEPEALLTILTAPERSLPFLQRSLFALLYRYPDLRTGLNAWDDDCSRTCAKKAPRQPGSSDSRWRTTWIFLTGLAMVTYFNVFIVWLMLRFRGRYWHSRVNRRRFAGRWYT